MAVGDAHVFPGFLTPVLRQLFFPGVRGENTPERKFASNGDRTHNYQVMRPTPSPLSHPGVAGFYLLELPCSLDYLPFQSSKLMSQDRKPRSNNTGFWIRRTSVVGARFCSKWFCFRLWELRHNTRCQHLEFFGSQ